MTDPRTPDPDERAVAELLEANRPQPQPWFQGALGRYLASEDPGWGPRPDQLWIPAIALIAFGAVLLVIGALISAGGI